MWSWLSGLLRQLGGPTQPYAVGALPGAAATGAGLLGGAAVSSLSTQSALNNQGATNSVLRKADNQQQSLVSAQQFQDQNAQGALAGQLQEDQNTQANADAAAGGYMPAPFPHPGHLLKNDGLRTVRTSLNGVLLPPNLGSRSLLGN